MTDTGDTTLKKETLTLLALSAALLMASGCGRDALQYRSGAVEDGPADNTPQPCQSDEDCDGGWCTGEPGCDAQWYCVEETPCSAAPGFTACTCDGVYSSLASGCPQAQYAYEDAFAPPHLIGASCNTQERPQWRSLNLRGVGFNSLEGLTVHLTLMDPVTGRSANEITTSVLDGEFLAQWYSIFDANVSSYDIFYWIDVRGDGVCEDDFARRRFSTVANNPFNDDDPIEALTTLADVNPGLDCP